MVQLSSAIAALALAVSSVEALALAAPSFELRCYGLNGPSQDSTSFSSWAGEGRSEERNHVKNMCKGYSDGNGYHRGALQDVSAQSVRQRPTLPANLFLRKTYFKGYNESPLPATVCVNMNDDRKLIVQVTNEQDNGRNLSQDNCLIGLDNIVLHCFFGSESIKWGWKFRSVLSSDTGCGRAGLKSMLIGYMQSQR
jgi:hypothetical protein